MIPDAHSFRAGVTTFVDAGTAGADHFADFKRRWIDTSRTRILAFVNIARGAWARRSRTAQLQPDLAAAVAAEHPDVVVGIKTAHYWTSKPWDEVHQPWVSVDAAVRAGELSRLPVMVDFWPRPPERPYPDLILEHMRPGDIHTHVFAQQFPILTEEGRDRPNPPRRRPHVAGPRAGRPLRPRPRRGAASGSATPFRPSVRASPDSISTDLHMGSVNAAVLNTLHTASKCLAMGMPLQEVVYRTTVTPAQAIRRPQLGTLSEGRKRTWPSCACSPAGSATSTAGGPTSRARGAWSAP